MPTGRGESKRGSTGRPADGPSPARPALVGHRVIGPEEPRKINPPPVTAGRQAHGEGFTGEVPAATVDLNAIPEVKRPKDTPEGFEPVVRGGRADVYIRATRPHRAKFYPRGTLRPSTILLFPVGAIITREQFAKRKAFYGIEETV